MLHVHAPAPDVFGINTRWCPTCKVERGFLVEHVEWYGWSCTCLFCGDEWQEEERLERPFRRGWRQASVADAIKRIEEVLHGRVTV